MTITGVVTYDFVPATYSPATRSGGLQFAQAQARPARNVIVQVIHNNQVIGSAVTSSAGSYQVSFAAAGGTSVAVVALTRTNAPRIQVEDNTDQNAVWAIGRTVPAQNSTVNLHATHGWTGSSYSATTRLAAPFAALDSMYTAATAFIAARPAASFPDLKVNWSPNNVPQAGDKAQGQIGTSHFAFADGEIYVLGRDGVDTDEFDSHVIVHEWGHYFERNLSRSDSPGGRHGPGDVLDPRIAFGEAWGNALASMLLPESVYADTAWRSGTIGAFGFDTETEPNPTDDPTPNAFSESSVMRVLYDIWDPNNEAHDQVGTGLGPIYDVMVGPQRSTEAMTTLASFIAGLKAQGGVNPSALDGLLAERSIGPLTSQWGDGDNGLRNMFFAVPQLPWTGAIDLGGGNPPNSWQQNQYYVFTGTGGQITLSATSNEDVGIRAFRRGQVVGQADSTLTGTETFAIPSQAGSIYVLVLTGFGTINGDYTVNVSIQ